MGRSTGWPALLLALGATVWSAEGSNLTYYGGNVTETYYGNVTETTTTTETTTVYITAATTVATVGIGFCLDNITTDLVETGFTGISAYGTEAACTGAGFEWCPLQDRTATWTPREGASPVIYYYWSSCCTGRQGRRLIVDSAVGKPTCVEGKPEAECAGHDWTTKLTEDLLGSNSGYDWGIEPHRASFDPAIHTCICAPTDPKCSSTTPDGSLCLVCEQDAHCGPNPVGYGINFFKVHTINVRTSQLWLSVWLRAEWYDPRLAYDPRCYGDSPYFVALGARGTAENTKIWTPDIELYNSDDPLSVSFAPRLGMIYGCWSGTPSRSGCGYVWHSNPGIMKALCKYDGLVLFPDGAMTCHLELAAWTIGGSRQDIRPRAADGGYGWVDDPNKDVLAGLTAGSSYQDFQITNISVKRMVVQYDCCPGQSWPTLLYSLSFKRSVEWYESKLVFPMIVVTTLSFAAFWMSPKVGERLGFGMTAVLAIVTSDITASNYMPMAEERTFLNYLSLVSQGFCWFSLLESAFVLFIHHQDCDGWMRAFFPRAMRMALCPTRLPQLQCEKEIRSSKAVLRKKSRPTYKVSKDSHERDHLFRKMFTELDRNYTGFLEPDELLYFGSFILGSKFRTVDDLVFLRGLDDGSTAEDGLHISLQDFVNFCETKIPHMEDTAYLRRTAAAFLQVSRRRNELLRESWQAFARSSDTYARFAVPLSYLVFLCVLFSQDASTFKYLEISIPRQLWIMTAGVWPMALVGVVFLTVHVRYQLYLRKLLVKAGGINQGLCMDVLEKCAEEAERRASTDGACDEAVERNSNLSDTAFAASQNVSSVDPGVDGQPGFLDLGDDGQEPDGEPIGPTGFLDPRFKKKVRV